MKIKCEHPSTTLTKDWEWVICADKKCGAPIKQNPDAPSIRIEHMMAFRREHAQMFAWLRA